MAITRLTPTIERKIVNGWGADIYGGICAVKGVIVSFVKKHPDVSVDDFEVYETYHPCASKKKQNLHTLNLTTAIAK